jgi:glycolate oxidase FAD binding subunit
MAADPFEVIVGTQHCAAPEDDRLDGTPVARIVRPGSPAEVAHCLAEARASGRPIVASGAGSKLGWGNRTDAKQLVRLELTRLDSEMDLQAEEGIVTVRAGVEVERLARAAADHGKHTLLCELYPGATVGGTIAADPLCLDLKPDWRLRDDILGIQVAHPSGELTRAGGKVVKNVSGFDLVRLYCGSFGTLGVVTEATLRLRPLPETRTHWRRDFQNRGDALTLARDLPALEPRSAALVPAAEGASLLWLLEGTEADVARRASDMEGTRVPPEELDAAGREAAGLTPRPEGSVRVRIAARASDTRPICDALVHVGGDEALRLVLPLAGVVLAEIPEAELPRVFERADRESWSAFVEQASPQCKAEIDVFGPPPDSLPLMRAIKQRFDPDRVLAPGRFVGRI